MRNYQPRTSMLFQKVMKGRRRSSRELHFEGKTTTNGPRFHMLIFHGEVARLSGGRKKIGLDALSSGLPSIHGVVTVTEFQKISNYVTRRRGVASMTSS